MISPAYRRAALALMCFILLCVAGLSLCWGQVPIAPQKILLALGQQLGLAEPGQVSREQLTVIWYIRLPRLLVAGLVGAGLALSGAVMQGIFSNPLADPGLLGVSSGAAAGAVLALATGAAASSMLAMPAFALAGSLVAVCLTVGLARRQGRVQPLALLLAGVAVGMLLGAVTSGLLTFMNQQQLQQYLFWMVGGLDYRRWEHVYLAAGPVLMGMVLMLALARQLNILVLGEAQARSVGMAVGIYRLLLLSLASLTTATCVCVSGNIGFVGLVMPHMLRLLFGPDHRLLLPASVLGGAIFLIFCDTLGRMLLSPIEIRVGIMTALVGTPYFLYLLRRLQQD